MSHVIGIDLGTSNSCVAYVQDGKPVTIPDEEGNRTVPSIFALSPTLEPLVGEPAKRQAASNRENTIFAVKRLIGRKFNSEEVRQAAPKLPYKIIPAENGDCWVEVNGMPMSPEEVSSHVLRRMKEIAEHYLKEKVYRAVITVPAHFNDSQRQATKDAGRLAGLDVMRIINEPTAASLAFGLDLMEKAKLASKVDEARMARKNAHKIDRMIAVFDLGGGTFDVSILSLKDGIFDVLATNGDTFLGGEDLDLKVVEHLLEQFKRSTGTDLRGNKGALEKLKSAARDAKHDLTYKKKVEINLPFVQGMEHFSLMLTRRALEEITMPILKRMEDPCLWALEDAKLKPSDITDCILVGGMTRMPAVKQVCEKIFGFPPLDAVDPDEAVALGAAVQAGLLEGLVKGVSLLDVTSLSLGLEIQGGKMHPIIPRNTTVPVKVTQIFTTSAPNQPQVSIHILQGESDFAPENKSLGRFELMGIRPAPRGEPNIAVSFEVDSEGIVHVAAKDLETGEEQQMEVIASSGLSDEELEIKLRENRLIQEQLSRQKRDRSLAMDEDDSDELGAVKRQLKEKVFFTQTRLATEGQGFKGSARYLLEESLSLARSALDTADDMEELNEALGTLAERAKPLEEYIEGVYW